MRRTMLGVITREAALDGARIGDLILVLVARRPIRRVCRSWTTRSSNPEQEKKCLKESQEKKMLPVTEVKEVSSMALTRF